MRIGFSLYLFLLFSILAQNLSSISNQPPTKPVEFIVGKVLEKTQNNDQLKKENLTYKRIYTVESLNDKKEVVNKDKEEVVLIEKGGRERTLERNGKGNKGNSRVSAPKFDLIKALESLIKFHDFEINRIDMIDNRPYYLISFRPKADRSRTNDDVEEIIVRSEGWMYVDLEKFYISQITVWITRSYSRGWGIFNLTRANVDMAQEELDGIIVMKSIKLIDKYSFFGFDTFEKQTWTYQDYQF